MLNKTVLMGRLTRDPELRTTANGTQTASFSLAVERDFTDRQTGERGVDFIDIVAWRGTAEFVGKYFTKGRMAVVEGRLQVRYWTTQDGQKLRSFEVVADHVYFGDSRTGSAPHPSPLSTPSPQGEGFGTAEQMGERTVDNRPYDVLPEDFPLPPEFGGGYAEQDH